MKKRIIKVLLNLFILFCLVSLIGCGQKESEPFDGDKVALAIIGGLHDNLGEFDKELSFDSSNSGNDDFLKESDLVVDIFGIVADCKPNSDKLENEKKPKKNSGKIYYKSGFEKAVKDENWIKTQNMAKNFLEKFSSIKADDEEVDILEAIEIAKTNFQKTDKERKNLLLIYDSGLCTSGELSFLKEDNKKYVFGNKEINDDELEEFWNDFSDQNIKPDFNGITIKWYGMGIVGGSQEKLNKYQKYNLQKIWEKVLKESGAKATFVNLEEKKSTEDYSGLKYVSTVDLEVAIPIDSLKFKEKSAEFEVSEDEREKVLKPFLNEGHFLLVGTASSDGEKIETVGVKLSGDRAEAVRSEFIRLESKCKIVDCFGLGTGSHKYDRSEFINGKYNGECEAAKRNRSVYIVPYNSEDAVKFQNDRIRIKQKGYLN